MVLTLWLYLKIVCYFALQTWEKKYLHPEYKAQLGADVKVAEPCPDVFWFPLVTETFCWHLIEEVENYGQWSAGKHEVKHYLNTFVMIRTLLLSHVMA